ncbi:MAG: NYN domain-containing protein [Fimbriimonas sp.]
MRNLLRSTTTMAGPNSNPYGNLALLIDADNAHPKYIDALLTEIAKYGIVCLRRAYGDWSNPNLAHWKECLFEHSIQAVHQFAYATGKNSTDIAMVIDAMDLLHTDRFEGFCLVSSDSDFTRLAVRIREQGLKVYGFGKSQTPLPFVKACDFFLPVDDLKVSPAPKPKTPSPSKPKPAPGAKPKATPATPKSSPPKAAVPVEKPVGTDLHSLLRAAVATASDEKGWADLTTLGNHLKKQTPDFTSQKYGYPRLSDLVEATRIFEVDNSAKAFSSIRVRLKTGAL